MLRFLFRIKRKLNLQIGGIHRWYKCIEWKTLYAERFAAGKNLVFGKLFAVYYDASASQIYMGTDVQFRDFCQLRTGMNGKLSIGNRVFFNNYCSITCFNSISIGDDCQFGEGVKFYDHNHQYKSGEQPINQQGYRTGTIRIGNNCWFGSDVIILKDVEIGDNVIIGTGCIIHKSIPSGSVIVNKQELIFYKA
jgi:acetyltransferase-like isoleucine patch superfamily enzyme